MATKKAVVVGINDYSPVGVGGPDLAGCVNDARDMANTLVICGFSPANIRILTNQNATKANILRYLKWLLVGCKAGDSLVFYYSGHGTQVANFGPELEIDGVDEAIVPHDYPAAGYLKDDDFKALFDEHIKPKVNLEVIFDCCHSGTGTRDFNAFVTEAETADLRVRMLPPSLEDEFYAVNRMLMDEPMAMRALVSVANTNHTLWAACKDAQLSYESNIGGLQRGHFTYCFCKVLRATSGIITRKKLDAQVKTALLNFGQNQTNQVESRPAEFSQNIFH